MTKPLKRIPRPTLYHYVYGERIDGPNPALSGICTGLRGDCSELWGDCTGLWGDCTDLSGDLDEIPMDARPCALADWVED